MIVQPKAFRIVGGTDIPEPTFTASAVEKLAIKRFLDFAALDVKYQLQKLNKVDLAGVERNQIAAKIISVYLIALRAGVDGMPKIETSETDNGA